MTENNNMESLDDVFKKLYISAYAGDMHFIVSYLREGGPASFTNTHGDTILHAAADGWQHRMVEFLIIWGVNVNAQNKDGDTPLHVLTRSSEVPFEGKLLLDSEPEQARRNTFRNLRKTDTSIKNIQGANALHLAAYRGDLVAIQELYSIDRKSLIDEVTSKGVTALTLAILEEHVECVKLLINLGANINFKMTIGSDSFRPIDLLHSSENAELRSLI